jgi:8-oxo-dGTP diphosphatase
MPEATVSAIITTPDRSKFLITRRKTGLYQGRWCLPGGHIDRDETLRDAVIREVKEETGLDFAPRLFSCFDEIIPEHDIHTIAIVFDGLAYGTITTQVDEVAEIGWYSLGEIREMAFAFRHKDIIESYAHQRGIC